MSSSGSNLSKSEQIRRALPRPGNNEVRPTNESAQKKELNTERSSKNQEPDSSSGAGVNAPCDQIVGPLRRYILENIGAHRENYSPSKVLYDFRRWLRETDPGVYEVYAHCFVGDRLWFVREMVKEEMSKAH